MKRCWLSIMNSSRPQESPTLNLSVANYRFWSWHHMRRLTGEKVSSEEADSYTGSMSNLLHRTAGCYAMLSHYCCVADPCWYLETPMRRAFTDVVKAGQIGLVVLLLGSSWHEAPGLQIGCYGPSENTCQDYVNRLKQKLGPWSQSPLRDLSSIKCSRWSDSEWRNYPYRLWSLSSISAIGCHACSRNSSSRS